MKFKDNYQEIDIDNCRATTVKRFANYLIDLVVSYIIAFGVTIILRFINPELLNGFDELSGRLTFLLIYGIVMFITEAMSNGRSVGKLITGTRVVNPDGSDITFQKAFIRNMVRAIPFIAFSALGKPCAPWHDLWSDTIVVEEKKVTLQRQRIHLFNTVKNRTL
jgi:uncharacterized RDD family membrane protein YckC